MRSRQGKKLNTSISNELKYRVGFSDDCITIPQDKLSENPWIFINSTDSQLVSKINIDSTPLSDITDISEEYMFLNNVENTDDATYKSSDYILELKSGKIENKFIKLQKYK